jgi:hypothetical protein
MFLTQKHPLTVTSVNTTQDIKIRSKEFIRQNAYVLQEIENILQDYPEYPYQIAFSSDELRAQLVAHVLRYVPTCCSVIGDTQKPTTNAKFSYRSKWERLRLDALIRGSILHLLRENADWIGRQIQRLDNSLATH